MIKDPIPGMGAFSPSKYHTSEIADECMKTIFDPTIKALNKEGIKFKGVCTLV